VPDKRSWLDMLGQLELRIAGAMGRAMRAQGLALGALAQRLQISHPGAKLAQHAQRLDDLEQRMRLALRASVGGRQQALESLSTRLWRENPRHRLEALCSHAAALRQRLLVAFTATRGALDQRLALASRTLDAVSPLATLGRGYAIVQRVDDGSVLRDASQAAAGTEIEARLSRGRLRATVTGHSRDEDA